MILKRTRDTKRAATLQREREDPGLFCRLEAEANIPGQTHTQPAHNPKQDNENRPYCGRPCQEPLC